MGPMLRDSRSPRLRRGFFGTVKNTTKLSPAEPGAPGRLVNELVCHSTN